MSRRFELVFDGVVDLAEWQAAADRLPLVERRFGPAREAGPLMLLAVVEQLLSDEPPQVWETVQRLVGAGLDTDDVMDQLMLAFAQTVQESRGAGSFDHDRYTVRLGRLPLPDPAVIGRALLDTAAAAVVIETDALVAQVAEQMGGAGDDPLVVRLVKHIEEQLADEGGPLVRLPGDRTGHAARLSEGIVLTHVLDDADRDAGVLGVSFDLAAFGRASQPTFDGEPLEWISHEPGQLAWRGPRGWLDRFRPGTVVAVRVGGDGAVEVEALPAIPPVDPRLVAALREVYDAAVGEPQLPVPGEELLFGLLAYDPMLFERAHAPLSVLCDAAGLDERAAAVAHDAVAWANQRRLGRRAR